MEKNMISTNDSINGLQELIAKLMTREVILSREILANMRQEEDALLSHDDSALRQIMSKRDAPLQELMSVREDRIDSVKELVHMIHHLKVGQKNPRQLIKEKNEQIASLLDGPGDEGCEVLILRDQLIALIEKMNLQNSSNIQLSNHHHEHAKAINEHLDSWGYTVAHAHKPVFIERRKPTGTMLMNQE